MVLFVSALTVCSEAACDAKLCAELQLQSEFCWRKHCVDD
jgi:hypothetical protein